jgi:hypothetical protein
MLVFSVVYSNHSLISVEISGQGYKDLELRTNR